MHIPFIINEVMNSITYILPVGNERDCWLVDCGDVEKIIAQGWNIRGVLLTHAHTDHIYGINKALEVFPDTHIYTNVEGYKALLSPKYNLSYYHDDVDDFIVSHPDNIKIIKTEGSLLLAANLSIQVLFTPGHDCSCLSYIIHHHLFTGDAYIPGVKTIVTFPRSNKAEAQMSLQRLQSLELEGYTILPGHYVENK